MCYGQSVVVLRFSEGQQLRLTHDIIVHRGTETFALKDGALVTVVEVIRYSDGSGGYRVESVEHAGLWGLVEDHEVEAA